MIGVVIGWRPSEDGYLPAFDSGGRAVSNEFKRPVSCCIFAAEGLSAKQSADEFDATLNSTIQSIYDASIT